MKRILRKISRLIKRRKETKEFFKRLNDVAAEVVNRSGKNKRY